MPTVDNGLRVLGSTSTSAELFLNWNADGVPVIGVFNDAADDFVEGVGFQSGVVAGMIKRDGSNVVTIQLTNFYSTGNVLTGTLTIDELLRNDFNGDGTDTPSRLCEVEVLNIASSAGDDVNMSGWFLTRWGVGFSAAPTPNPAWTEAIVEADVQLAADAVLLSLEVDQYSDFRMQLNVTDEDGAVLDLTGWTAIMEVRDRPAGTLRLTMSTANGSITLGNGYLRAVATYVDVDVLTPTSFAHDIWLQNPAGTARVAIHGPFIVNPGITIP